MAESALSVSAGKKPGQQHVRVQVAPHVVPERRVRQGDQVECLAPGETKRAVVVRIVAGLLQPDEGGRDLDQRLGDRPPIDPDESFGEIRCLAQATAVGFIGE